MITLRTVALPLLAFLLLAGCGQQSSAEPTASAAPTTTSSFSPAVAGAGCCTGSVSNDPSASTTAGTFLTTGVLTVHGDCTNAGFDDISAGTEVDVSGPSGTVLAYSHLIQGAGCRFAFVVPNIPEGQQFYGVTVSHRGTVHFSPEQMRSIINISIG